MLFDSCRIIVIFSREKGGRMKTREKEKVRQAVRERYAKVATLGTFAPGPDPTASCCTPDLSVETSPEASCCGGPECTPEQMCDAMGYSKEDMDSVPEGANMGLGCGNPVAIASLKPGETVVDLGSGGGFDCFLASKQVGETGRVIGVDMTSEMVGKARNNAEKMGTSNVEFRLGEIEHLPVADNSADVIMSNCVINLSPDKLSVYRDALRVLKPGGRLAISDIVASAELPDDIQKNLALVSACVGGAATVDDTERMLKEAGFQGIKITPKDESRQMIDKWFPGKNAGQYIVSAYIDAVKPSPDNS
jgi:ubiquinone/menaquinone biosynthesis C-methylase UbiE